MVLKKFRLIYKNISKREMIILSFPFVFLLCPLLSMSQNYGLEIGLTAGTSYYMGDINTCRQFYRPGFAGGGYVKFHFPDRIALRLGYTATSLKGKDSDFANAFQQTRNLSFNRALSEISVICEISFLPYLIGDKSKNRMTPYISAGATACIFGTNIQDDAFIAAAIPMGIGFRCNIRPRLVLTFDWSFRWCISDMVDGITNESWREYSEAYGTEITSQNNAKQSGFRYTNDWYSIASVSLSYAFKLGGLGCPAYYERKNNK